MFVIVYRVSEGGPMRARVKLGAEPYATRKEAEVCLSEFKREYDPVYAEVMELKPC